MDEEVSTISKVAITVVMLAAFLAIVMLLATQSEKIMDTVENRASDAVKAVSIQNIVRLQNHKRNYIDLYKTYLDYEPYINSITGVKRDSDGNIIEYRVHYLRNIDNVFQGNDPDHMDYSGSKICTDTLTGLSGSVNIDEMYDNFLNEYAYTTQDKLLVYVYKSTMPQEYDIYYEVIEN
jgi:lipopolysaccharide export LptBFGC system permease protein LptF